MAEVDDPPDTPKLLTTIEYSRTDGCSVTYQPLPDERDWLVLSYWFPGGMQALEAAQLLTLALPDSCRMKRRLTDLFDAAQINFDTATEQGMQGDSLYLLRASFNVNKEADRAARDEWIHTLRRQTMLPFTANTERERDIKKRTLILYLESERIDEPDRKTK